MSQTVREGWREGVRFLKDHGFSHPSQEVRWLMAAVLKTEPARVHLYWDHQLSPASRDLLTTYLKRRSQGVPLQYVIGEWEFMSCALTVREGVFIPRLDTEAWVEQAVWWLRQKRRPARMLDLCCGSGAIACACAFWVPKLMVLGADLSEQAVTLARWNAYRNHFQSRVRFVLSDLFRTVRFQRHARFDLIVSNPPYIRLDEWETLPVEVRLHEPEQALLAGTDGMEIIRRILAEGGDFLEKDGIMIIEHAPGQTGLIRDQLENHPVLEFRRTIADSAGQERATVTGQRTGEKGVLRDEPARMG